MNENISEEKETEPRMTLVDRIAELERRQEALENVFLTHDHKHGNIVQRVTGR